MKVTIYMVDLRELMDTNAVFSQYFPIDPPARTTFQCAALVVGARVEIEPSPPSRREAMVGTTVRITTARRRRLPTAPDVEPSASRPTYRSWDIARRRLVVYAVG